MEVRLFFVDYFMDYRGNGRRREWRGGREMGVDEVNTKGVINLEDWHGERYGPAPAGDADGEFGRMSALEFVEKVLKEKPYKKQEEILNLVDSDARRISVVGCNGSGKDWTTARIVLWWVHRFAPAMAIVTGPTLRQVEDIVWNEVRYAHGKAADRFPGKMLKNRYVIDEKTFALGFTSNSEHKIIGFHSPNLLAVITEAHALPDEYYHAVRRLHPSKLLLTGNPFTKQGVFYDSHHRNRDLWETVQIGAKDTPNILEGKVVYPGLITAEDVEDHKQEWGEDSPLYISSVLGEFPPNLDDVLVPLVFAEAAVERELKPEGEVVVACDVAHKGHDHTVVMRRQGGVARIARRVRGYDNMEVAGLLKSYCDENRVDVLVIDGVGVGTGVVDRLREVGLKTARLEEFNGGHNARRGDRFANRNAEVWWAMRERYLAGELDTENDDKLIGQVCTREYAITSGGLVKLQSKKDLKDSPDEADALAMTFAPQPEKGRIFKIWV